MNKLTNSIRIYKAMTMKTIQSKSKNTSWNHALENCMLKNYMLRPVTVAMIASVVAMPLLAQQKQEQVQDRNDGMTTEARGRMSDSSSPDKRASEINLVDQIPRSSEQMLPKEVFILRGLEREMEKTETTETIPGSTLPAVVNQPVVTPGSATSTPRFDSGEDILTPSYTRQLDEIVAKAQGKSNLRFRLIGHTDVQRIKKELLPRFPDNMALGLARAKQVGGYLQNKLGLPASAFSFDTRGSTEPVAMPKEDVKNWPTNRRVVVEVFYDDVAPAAANAAPVVTPPTTKTITTLNDPTVCKTLTAPAPADAGAPFRVSVDGNPVDATQKRHEADVERCVDVALEKGAVRIQYDNLATNPQLNVNAWPPTAKFGETIAFKAWSNYRTFLKKAEVRVFTLNSIRQVELLATLPLNEKFEASWPTKEGMPADVFYRLRVYDANGNFDETSSQTLSLVNERRPVEEDLPADKELLAGYGQNRLDIRNIKIEGGTLTAYGDKVPREHTVVAFGLPTPVDAKGSFVMQQIVPRVYNTAEVAVTDKVGKATVYRRNLALPKDDWFFVGQADIVAGRNSVSGPAALVTGDKQHYNNDTYVDGRIAAYAKKKVDNQWTFTGAIDTFYQPINEIFKNFNYKDTNSLFRRLDAKNTWPVWGDDSTLVWDAPTQGKIYAKLEDGKSHILWGNFRQSFTETQLTQVNRGLYGANAKYQGDATTSFGERIAKVELFAADPGTLSAREDFRGTGGSLYYLRNQDLSRGSERVRIEIRDRDSNFVILSRPLVNGTEYTVDYLQGRVFLTTRLPSVADDSELVRAGSLSGNPVFLVVDYEFTPLNIGSSNMAYGGRASLWINDSLKLGITGTKQEQIGVDQQLGGVDITYRLSEGTFIKAEAGRTKGPGVGERISVDGGFNFAQTPQLTTVNPNATKANGIRVEGQLDFKDVGGKDGKLSAYIQNRDAGYSAPGQLTERETRQIGAAIALPITDSLAVKGKFDQKNETNGYDTRAASLDAILKIDKNWSLSVGIRDDKRSQDGLLTTPTDFITQGAVADLFRSNVTGKRTDIAGRVDFASDGDWSSYLFGQKTIDRTGTRLKNDRIGVGGKYRISDRVTANGEISYGNGGTGAKAGVDYRVTDSTNVYLNYQVGSDRTDDGLATRNGALVLGGRSRFSDSLSMYTEHKNAIGELGGLTHVYGVDLVPAKRWTVGMSFENGRVGRETVSSLARTALALKSSYTGDDLKYGGALEWRKDESSLEERRSVLWRNNASYTLSRDDRLLGRFDFGDSTSNKGFAAGADFRDLMVGYAYRPADNDRWNTLVRLQYLYDLSAQSQLSASGAQPEFQQKSTVAAIDTTYDLTQRWSIGGKVAYRRGELRNTREDNGPWFSSTATLLILRADYKIVRNWDVLLEGRRLATQDSGARKGFLGAVYYHINENVKIGGGYNFTDFSDEITNLSYRSRGPFINLLGKW